MNISVVIPLYNKKNSIIDTIHTVLNQTVLPNEIVIVNDGSSDGSEQLVVQLNHPLIRLVHQKNAGVSVARNKGIEQANYEWIALLDADDIWKPTYLEEIEELAKEFPTCNVLGTAYELQDYKGNRISIILNKIPFKSKKGILTNYFEIASHSHPPLWSSAVVIKRKALLEVNGFPEGIKSGEDLLTWARLAVKNKIAYYLKPLAVFVQDRAHTYNDKPNRIPENIDIVGKELYTLYKTNKNIAFLKSYISFWKKMRASIYLRLGFRFKSVKESFKAIYYNPFNKVVYVYLFLTIIPNNLLINILKIK
jgi:glycosyltransferase involved in cell wall biosynthesis